MKRLRAIAALAWLALPGAQSLPPDSSRVEGSRSAQGALDIHAQAKVDAETVTVWSALTAYEEFPRFVAGLRRSEVVARDGSTATVVQQWRIPLLWFSIPVDVTVKSVERPPDLIEVHLVKGNLKQLDGRYQ